MWTVTLDTRTLLSLALAATGVTALAYSLGDGAEAADAARRAPRATHISQDIDDIVLLRLMDHTTAPKFVRVNADGTQETAEFAVPDGQRLVVTDVDYCVEQTVNSNAGVLRLRLQNKTTSAVAPAYVSASTSLGENLTSSGGTKTFGSSSGVITGFVVAPDARIVADIGASSSVRSNNTGTFNRNPVEIVLRGYLTAGE